MSDAYDAEEFMNYDEEDRKELFAQAVYKAFIGETKMTKQKLEVKTTTITVEGLSSKGAAVVKGVWYNISQYAKPLPKLEKGKTYEVEYVTNDKGMNFVQKAVECVGTPVPNTPVEVKKEESKPAFLKNIKEENKAAIEKAVTYSYDDKRQRLIVRQSSLAQAVTALVPNETATTEDILKLAEIFTNWVYEVPEPKQPKSDNPLDTL